MIQKFTNTKFTSEESAESLSRSKVPKRSDRNITAVAPNSVLVWTVSKLSGGNKKSGRNWRLFA